MKLYNCTQKIKEMAGKGTDNKHALAGIAFAELVMFIEEDHMADKMSLVQLCKSKMEQLDVKPVRWVHTTSLKQRQLTDFPNVCTAPWT